MKLVSESAPPVPGRVRSFQFDCADLPAAQASEMLHTRFGANFDLRMPSERPANQLGGRHFGFALGGLLLGRREMYGVSLSRTPELVRRSQMDHYMLVFSLEQKGPARHFFDDGRVLEQRGGDLMLLDMAQPMRVQTQAADDVSLFIPRDALDELLPRALDLHGVQPRGMVAGLLADHLGRLLQSAQSIGQAETPTLSQGILHMVAASLAPQADSLALARPQLDGLVLRRMGRYVEAQMANPDLCVEHLCAAFQLSRSHVYRLLEPVGGPAAFIRERRLSKAHELLAASDKHVAFKRLSSDCGFKSSSQFSRAFKEHFGYNAKELRGQTEEYRARAWQASGSSASALNPTRSLNQWLERVARPRVVA